MFEKIYRNEKFQRNDNARGALAAFGSRADNAQRARAQEERERSRAGNVQATRADNKREAGTGFNFSGDNARGAGGQCAETARESGSKCTESAGGGGNFGEARRTNAAARRARRDIEKILKKYGLTEFAAARERELAAIGTKEGFERFRVAACAAAVFDVRGYQIFSIHTDQKKHFRTYPRGWAICDEIHRACGWKITPTRHLKRTADGGFLQIEFNSENYLDKKTMLAAIARANEKLRRNELRAAGKEIER